MMATRCWVGLNLLNFWIAAIQTAFGPFFAVYLTERDSSVASSIARTEDFKIEIQRLLAAAARLRGL